MVHQAGLFRHWIWTRVSRMARIKLGGESDRGQHFHTFKIMSIFKFLALLLQTAVMQLQSWLKNSPVNPPIHNEVEQIRDMIMQFLSRQDALKRKQDSYRSYRSGYSAGESVTYRLWSLWAHPSTSLYPIDHKGLWHLPSPSASWSWEGLCRDQTFILDFQKPPSH